MAQRVKLGFVGAGYMGQLAHMANYAQLDDVELVALAEGRPLLAQKVAQRYGIKEVYPDHRELLANADVDAVIAIMWFSLHHAVVPDILEAGKHVFTEKAMCLRADTARAMAAKAEQIGVTYKIGYMKRSDPGSIHARALIQNWRSSGEAGEIRYLRCTCAMTDWTWGIEDPIKTDEPYPTYEGVEREPFPAWMNQEEGRRYESFVNFWIHQVNLIRYLLGESYEPRHVTRDGRLMVCESASGIPIVLEMNVHQVKNQWEEKYTICFDKGEVELDLGAPMHRQRVGRVRITTEGKNGREDSIPFLGHGWAFHEQARLFIKSARGEMPVISPPSDAVQDLEIAEKYIRMLSEAGAI